jgi:hypothetical protein
MTPNIIVSERPRPIWQIPVAALFFTIAAMFLISLVYRLKFNEEHIILALHQLDAVLWFSSIGVMFCYKKQIQIDIKNSRFKPAIAIGPIKIGRWQTIKNYKYISVFLQPLVDGSTTFEVNLWYDHNKHFELYFIDDYTEAFLIGYDLSEQLNIDLLDATVPNDFKWVDKNAWKAKIREGTST